MFTLDEVIDMYDLYVHTMYDIWVREYAFYYGLLTKKPVTMCNSDIVIVSKKEAVEMLIKMFEEGKSVSGMGVGE